MASLSTPRERPERVGALKLSVAEARGRSPPAHGGEGSRMDAQLKRHYTSRGSQQTLQTVTAVPAQRRAALPRRQQLGALTDPPHSRNQREMWSSKQKVQKGRWENFHAGSGSNYGSMKKVLSLTSLYPFHAESSDLSTHGCSVISPAPSEIKTPAPWLEVRLSWQAEVVCWQGSLVLGEG